MIIHWAQGMRVFSFMKKQTGRNENLVRGLKGTQLLNRRNIFWLRKGGRVIKNGIRQSKEHQEKLAPGISFKCKMQEPSLT